MASAKAAELLAQHIREKLAQGFHTPEGALKDAIEAVGDDIGEPDLDSIGEAALDQVMKDRQREQLSWPAVTDCDRLDAAFEDLNAQGIMARHHWTCCSNCARAEMPDEFERLGGTWNGVPITGYAYYHWQDTERAADGGPLYLGYGSTEAVPSEEEYNQQCLLIGRIVQSALASQGLKADWGGTLDTKIAVSLNWQRRKAPARFCGT